jgi:TnpA family transposase
MLEKLVGGVISTKQITAHWDEVLRLASSIQQGTVTASLMLRKLGAYPRPERTRFGLTRNRETGTHIIFAGVHPEHRIARAHSCWSEQRGGSRRAG